MPRAILTLARRERAADRALPLAQGRAIAVAVRGERGRDVARSIAGAIVVEDGSALPPDLGGLVDARALDAPGDVAGALAVAKQSLFIAQSARQALLTSAKAGGAFYVVVTSVGHAGHAAGGKPHAAAPYSGRAGACPPPSASLVSPVVAAVHGLLKTASLEWPEVACCALDVEAGVDVAAALFAELRCGFYDVEVARTALGRFVPVVIERAVTTSPAQRRVTSSSVIVASGGARGVTATTLLALAKSAQPALLLLGRTPLVDEPACCRGALDEAALKKALVADKKERGLPIQLAAIGEEAKRVVAVREVRAFLGELEAAGARVMYRAVDVRNVAEVSAACADARVAFGAVTGVVHGAGVLADKRIEDKTQDQVDRVMDTKVLGLAALLEATANDPVDVVALFSSVAGRFGNVGQVDYAMANEALNEMAVELARAKPGVVVKSLNWGPWEGGMVTPALKKLFAERGVRVLTHEDGARHFVDELGAADGVVEVVFGGELAPETKLVMPSETRRARFHVDSATFPELADHSVHGQVVLPVAGTIALLAKTAGSASFRDVRVLRGLTLPKFFDAGHDVEVEVAADGSRITLAVPGERAPRYSAVVDDTPLQLALGDAPGAPYPFDRARIYASLLFHGPRFRVIDVVDAMSDTHALARGRGCIALGWGESLAVDVGAIDGALQLALLWARHRTGGAFLPTSIARVHAIAPVAGGLRYVLRGRAVDDTRALVDVEVRDDAGRVLVALEGAELHRLKDDDAFAPDAERRRELAT